VVLLPQKLIKARDFTWIGKHSNVKAVAEFECVRVCGGGDPGRRFHPKPAQQKLTFLFAGNFSRLFQES
jgi:hypothetical protein